MVEVLRTTIEKKSVKVREYQGLPTVFARGSVNGERKPLMLITTVSGDQAETGYDAEEIVEMLMKKDGKPRFIGPYITDPSREPIRLVSHIDAVWQPRGNKEKTIMGQEQKHFLIDPESAVFSTSSGAITAKGRDELEGLEFQYVFAASPLDAAQKYCNDKTSESGRNVVVGFAIDTTRTITQLKVTPTQENYGIWLELKKGEKYV